MGDNGLFNPVLFDAGQSQRVNGHNEGFSSPSGGDKPEAGPNLIPPVVWVLVLLIGGYLGARWIMED